MQFKGKEETTTNLQSKPLVSVSYRWEELHAVASEPMESHVFFAEHFYDAVNGLYTTLATFSVCNSTPAGGNNPFFFFQHFSIPVHPTLPFSSAGCQIESFPCERKTLETVKELQGNFMCWKGSKGYSPYTSLCPYYRQVSIF